ncbi:MAG: S41 family peptidase [Planctomycetota bacterium]
MSHRTATRRVAPIDRSLGWSLGVAATLLVAPSLGVGAAPAKTPLPSSIDAATPVTPAPAATSEVVAIPEAALPAGAEDALREGRDLETRGLWADAVAHYEEAVREHPTDRRLGRRFDIARLHSSLERRYADESFRDSLGALTPAEAQEVHGELLGKIESHYVVTPPWTRLTHRGATAVLIAAGDPEFRRLHRIAPSDDAIRSLRAEYRNRLHAPDGVRNAREALRVAADLAKQAEARLGVPSAVWTMEFVAAAAGGLDNYSAYLTPGQLRDVYAQIEGNFVGLGVELKADAGALRIVRVIPGSPAERAGVLAGDLITAVDGQQTADLSTDEAAALLSGEEGSVAFVTIVTPDGTADELARRFVAKPVDGRAPMAGQPRTLRVRREHVDVPSIEGAKIADADYGVAYLRIPVFQKTTSRDVESALWDLHRQGMRSVVIDLRGNPGGLLTSSVELADKFIAQGGIVSTRGRSEGEDFDYRAHRAGTWRVPLVVLIDGDSASASEIFAAAIRDNRRGVIVGARSFGKGSVQGIFPMTRSGAGVRLTTAKFYSPQGQPISKVGVNPDIVVRRATSVASAGTKAAAGATATGETGERRVAAYRGATRDRDADRALSRAIEAARQQVAMR